MTLQETRHALDALGIHRLQAAVFLICPVAAALLAARRGRSIFKWAAAAFFMPLLAPFALLPLCSLWPALCGGYGVFADLVRLLAGPLCAALLWTRPAVPSSAPPSIRARARELALVLCFLAVLAFGLALAAFMSFPAQH